MGKHNCTNRSKKSRNRRHHRRYSRRRGLLFEPLEDRRVMAVDWRNPSDSLDVTGDTFVVPLDVLFVINELNASGGRRLPDARDPKVGFVDVNGDQNVSAIDALLIINAINQGLQAQRQLREGSRLNSETSVIVTSGQKSGVRELRMQIDAQFDTQGVDASIEDLLAVYVVDPANPSTTLLSRGTPGTSIFNLSGSDIEIVPGLTRWDGNILSIDLTSLAPRETAEVRFQLLGSDGDLGTRVSIRPLSNEVDADLIPLTSVFQPSLLADIVQVSSLTGIVPRSDVDLVVDNVRYDALGGMYAGEVSLVNRGAPFGRNAIVTFPGLPTGVTLQNPSGAFGIAGVPFLDLQSAIQAGGLATGVRSQPIPFQISDPAQTPFKLKLDVLASTNSAPTVSPLGTLSAKPGDVLRTVLSATDPDLDRVTFALNQISGSVNAQLEADNSLTISPEPTDVGTHRFELIASDGILESRQTFSVEVTADSVTTTRVSGRVLKVDGQPLAGMQVEIGATRGLTQVDGSFLLDLGSGPLVSDTLKVRGELFPGPIAYPFIAEKLPLVLEHAVFPRVNNVIARPIFLPALDVASGKTINPAADTTVTTAAIPGASVLVKAGTLMNQQGTPFTGVLSITDVPINLTPAALPDNLFPSLVVTIQPGEMVFATPAPLSLPNLGQLPPGTLMDLWSINPVTGNFDNVGTGRVSGNGAGIDTISGGIRNSSWHFFVPVVVTPADPNENQRNQKKKDNCDCCPPPYEKICRTAEVESTSAVELHSGELTEDHQLVGYQSLGQERSLQLRYGSLRADPRPILHFGLDNAAGAVGGTTVDLALGRLSFTHNGVTEQLPGFEVPPGSAGLLPVGSHFWRLPAGTNDLDLALQASLRNKPSGVYRFDLTFGIQRFTGLTVLTGALQTFSRNETIVNKRLSVFGAGWDLAELQEIIENEDGSILLIAGNGAETIYDPPATVGGPFVSPPGDFGVMQKLADGTYRYTDKLATVTQFIKLLNGSHQIGSITDRNGNRTSYEYGIGGNISRIVDPVGLATTFAINAVGKVTSITDPAGRVTQLIHAGENLVEIRDPDGTSRKFEYDSERRMTAEIDKRGFREEEVYGFHGRIIQTKDKEGQVRQFEPVQAQGLFPFEKTTNRNNPPTAAIVLQNVAESRHTEPNGNVIVTTMNQAGVEIAKRDSVGALPTQERNANGQPTRIRNARGNVTNFTYDAKGNTIRVVDKIARQGPAPTLFGNPIFSTLSNPKGVAVGDINNDGKLDLATSNPSGDSRFPSGLSIRLGNGDLTFRPRNDIIIASGLTTGISGAIAFGHLNADTNLDLIVNQDSNTAVRLGNGDGTFGNPITLVGGNGNRFDLVLADVDLDNDVDIVASTLGAQGLLFRNNGNGTFATAVVFSLPASTRANVPVAVADVNNDARPDLIFGRGEFLNNNVLNGSLNVFLNDGIGGFANVITSSALRNVSQISLGDFNKDGNQDVVLFGHTFGSQFGQIVLGLQLGNGDGTFSAPTTIHTLAGANQESNIVVADVNGDDNLDLVSTLAVNQASTVPQIGHAVEVVLGNGNGTFAAPVEFVTGRTVETGGDTIALADLNGDGTRDLVVVNSGDAVSVLRGLDAGTFEQVGRTVALNRVLADVQVVDFDRDNIPDLLMRSPIGRGNELLLRVNSGGNFDTEIRIPNPDNSSIVYAAADDFTGDQIPDIVMQSNGRRIIVLPGRGDNTFGTRIDSNVGSINFLNPGTIVADFDGDGDLDFVVPSVNTASSVGLFRNSGTGSFPSMETLLNDPQIFVRYVAAGDIDGDTDQDLVLLARSNNNASTVVLAQRNNGNGTFAPATTIFSPLSGIVEVQDGIRLSDINDDQFLDLIVKVRDDSLSTRTSLIVVALGSGEGTFGAPTTYRAGTQGLVQGVDGVDGEFRSTIYLSDFNQDGRPDILTTNAASDSVSILFNAGNGQFESDAQFFAGRIPTAAAIADLDNDGFIDFATINLLNIPPRETGQLLISPSNGLSALLGIRNLGAKTFSHDPTFSVVTRITNEIGQMTLFELDPATGNALKHITVIGQPGGGDDLETTFTNNSRGQVVTSTDPLGRITESGFDAFGRLIQVTSAKGTADESVTRFEYDAAGNVSAQIDPRGFRTEDVYDSMNRLVRSTDPLGNVTTFTYDANGNQTATTDARGNMTRFEYDRLNRQNKVIDPLGGQLVRTFDANGNVVASTDPLSRTTRFRFDARDRQIQVIDPAGGTIKSAYDPDNNLVRITDQAGAVTTQTFDARNRVVAVTDALGGVKLTIFDPADQVVVSVDELGQRTQFRYDDAGRQTETIDALGGVNRVEYDKANNVTRRIDQLNRATVFSYDNLNRQVRITDALGGQMNFAYDAASNFITERDKLNHTTTNAYDGLNRLVSVTNVLGGVSRTTFDAVGNIVALTDQRGNVTRFEFDALNRETKVIDAAGGELRTEYDAASQVVKRIDPLGRTTRTTFDVLGNVVTSTNPRGFVTAFSYTPTSQLASTTDPLGNVSRVEYDRLNRITKEIDPLGKAIAYEYDAADNPTAVTDRRGNVTRFAYDALNREVKQTDALGGTVISQFDAASQIVRTTDPLGRQTQVEYDALGRRTKIIDALGGTRVTAYDAMDNVTSETDALGRTTRFSYDVLDRVFQEIDALGNVTEFGYDGVANLLSEKDARGNVTRHEYDVVNRRTRTIDALGGVKLKEYDAADQVIRETDELNRVTEHRYDPAGNRIRTTDPLGNSSTFAHDARNFVVRSTNALDQSFDYGYDALGRRVRTTDPLGNSTVTEFDAKGNVASSTDERGNTTRFVYDALDRQTEIRDALGGRVLTAYDAAGQVTSSTDRRGNATTIVYDALGRPTRTTDALGGVNLTTYDAVGNVLNVTDELNRSTRFAYDALNRRTETTDARNNKTQFVYDAVGNQTRVTNARGNALQTEFDPLNRPVRVIDALGGVETAEFDGSGQVVSVTDELNHKVRFEYDAAGNRTRTTDPLGNVTRFVYNADHELTQTIDALNQTTANQYDALHRVVQTTDARGDITRYAYDAAGNVTRITDASNNATTYEFDALNRAVSETNPLGLKRLFTYDANSNLIERTDRNGRRIAFTYDALNRQTVESWFVTGNANPIHTIARTFDAADQLTGLNDAFATYGYTYSNIGELLSATNSGTPGVPVVILANTFDANSNRISTAETIAGTAAATTNRTFDALDRLSRVTQSGTGVAPKRVDVAYDAASRIVGVDRFADLAGTTQVARTQVTIDANNRATQVLHEKASTPLARFDNTFDALNRITRQVSVDGNADFSYDAISQLTAADFSFQADQQFSFDATGNRTGGTTIGANNRLLADSVADYAFDNEGNLARRTERATGRVTDYNWDHRNRLTRTTAKDVAGTIVLQVDFRYDALNRRIAKVTDADGAGAAVATTVQFVYDGDQIALTFDGAGVLKRRVLSGQTVDQVFAEEAAGQVLWSLTDHLGTVRDVLDSAGVLANHLTYNSFGQITAQSNAALGHLFSFTSREFDPETGLYYYRNRYYDAQTGRFLSEDPFGFGADDVNLTRYVGNNPTNLTDPFGLDAASERDPVLEYLQFRDQQKDKAFEFFQRYQDAKEQQGVSDETALAQIDAEIDASNEPYVKEFFRAATGDIDLRDVDYERIGADKLHSDGSVNTTASRVSIESEFHARSYKFRQERERQERDLAKQLVKDNGLTYDKETVDGVATAIEQARFKQFDRLRAIEKRRRELEYNQDIRTALAALSLVALVVPGGFVLSAIIDAGLVIDALRRANNLCPDDDPSLIEIIVPVSIAGLNVGLKLFFRTVKTAEGTTKIVLDTTSEEAQKIIKDQLAYIAKQRKAATGTGNTVDNAAGTASRTADDVIEELNRQDDILSNSAQKNPLDDTLNNKVVEDLSKSKPLDNPNNPAKQQRLSRSDLENASPEIKQAADEFKAAEDFKRKAISESNAGKNAANVRAKELDKANKNFRKDREQFGQEFAERTLKKSREDAQRKYQDTIAEVLDQARRRSTGNPSPTVGNPTAETPLPNLGNPTGSSASSTEIPTINFDDVG